MIKNIGVFRNISALLVNIAIVYLLYTICRIIFILYNPGLYANLTFSHSLDLLAAGLIFDSSAICYSNVLIILMFLLPLHYKEFQAYYTVTRWIYVLVNAICITANLCDVVYFPFTGRRTTWSVFAEFQNEGAGNIFNIFADQIFHNWLLLVAGVLMYLALWFFFQKPNLKTTIQQHQNLISYYIVNTISLAVIAYLCVGLMRGGFTHSTRPITISNANKYAENPAEAGAILNTPFSLMRTMSKKPMVTPNYMSQEDADAIFSPIHKSQFTINKSQCTDMNVVVLIMESFSKQHFGFFNDIHNENGEDGYKQSFTPFLDSLATKALTFRYSYSNGRKSIDGMPSVLSAIPSFVEPFFLTPASMNNLSGMARELTENKGYASAFFHGAENGSMGFEAFAKSTGFQKYYGRTEYNQDSNYNGDKDFDGTWAIWDEEFLLFYADRMDEMPQPFMTAVFTATSHPPFNLPERYKGVFPKNENNPLQETIAYSDNALRLFFEKVKGLSWFENTIFVITSDHVSTPNDAFYESVLGHYCVPIIFYAPGLPQLCGYDDTTIVEQTDIMPTVLGILGYDTPYVAFGQDILNTPKEEKFAIHWVPEYQGYEFVKGNYLIRFDGEDITAAYDFILDPLQKNNIAETMPRDVRDEMELEMKAVIQQYMKCMNGNELVVR